MTLYDAALREWRAIESVIRRALATGNAKVDGDVANRHEPLQIAGPPCAGLLTY